MSDTSGIKAGRAYVELGTSDQLSKGLAKAQAQLRAFAAGLQTIGKGLMAGGAAIIAPILASTRTFVTFGSHLKDISDRSGVGVKALSELGYAATQSGSSLEDVERGIRKMQRSVDDAGDGMATAVDSLAKLGLTVADLRDLTPEDQFATIAKRIGDIANPTTRAALAMELFGRSGTVLLPMIADMEALRGAARRLGVTMTTEDAAAAHALGDAMDDVRFTLRSVALAIGGAVAPMLQRMAQTIVSGIGMIRRFIDENRELVRVALQVGAAVAGIGAVLFGVGTAIKIGMVAVGGLGGMMSLVVGTVKALALILIGLTSPVGLVVAAFVALGGAALHYSDVGYRAAAWLGKTFTWLGNTFRAVLDDIASALQAGDIQAAAKVMWAGLKLAWITGVEDLRKIWSDLWVGFYTVVHEVLKTVTSLIGYFTQKWEQAFASISGWIEKMVNIQKAAFAAMGKLASAGSVNDLLGAFSGFAADVAVFNRTIDTKTQKAWDLADEAFTQTVADAFAHYDEAVAKVILAGSSKAKDAEEALRAARAELASAQIAVAPGVRNVVSPPSRPEFRDLESIIAAAGAKFGTAGTFAGDISHLMFGGTTPFRRMEDSLQELVRQNRELLRKARPLTFD